MQEEKIVLVRNCKDGNIEAFQQLYDIYSKEAFRTAYLIIGRREAAEDAVQETFIYCYRTIKALKKPEMFRSWMYKILVRTAWKVIKRENRHFKEPLEDYIHEIEDRDKNVSEIVVNRETSREIYNAIKLLSPNLRTVIILYYYNDISVKDISNIIGCSEGTIKSRLFNGRKALGDLLNKENISYSRISNFREGELY